jgi:hypothetical protein
MRKPQPPPTVDLAARLVGPRGADFVQQMLSATALASTDRYLPWDELRNRPKQRAGICATLRSRDFLPRPVQVAASPGHRWRTWSSASGLIPQAD